MAAHMIIQVGNTKVYELDDPYEHPSVPSVDGESAGKLPLFTEGQREVLAEARAAEDAAAREAKGTPA